MNKQERQLYFSSLVADVDDEEPPPAAKRIHVHQTFEDAESSEESPMDVSDDTVWWGLTIGPKASDVWQIQ